MVEVGHAFNLCPRLFTVALGAILPEFVVVDILVTAGAVGMWYVCEMLERLSVDGFFFVAINAGYFCVFPFQREIGLVMMEARYRFEALKIVTFRTVVGKSLPVIILMARKALLRKSKVGQFLVFQFGIGDELFFVAGLAVRSFVRSLKLKAG